MLVYQKTIFDCYYCIMSFCHLKIVGKKNTSKSSFLYYTNGAQKHEGFVGLENACCRGMTHVIIMSLNYVNFFARYC